MVLIRADRVLETTTSTGTGPFTLGGPVTSYKAVSDFLSNGDVADFFMEAIDSDGIPTNEYQTFRGTYNTGAVSVDSVYVSSNSNNPVNFAVGDKRIGISYAAAKAVSSDLMQIDDNAGGEKLTVAVAEALTAPRTLSVITGDADRTFTLTGDASIQGTNTGDQTSIVGITGTKAQFDTAVTDGNFLYVGDVTQYTDELAQDAIGAMINATLSYVDATPALGINLNNANSWTAAQTFSSVDINGGTVDGATIGATSQSTGVFSTLTVDHPTPANTRVYVRNATLEPFGFGISYQTNLFSSYGLPNTATLTKFIEASLVALLDSNALFSLTTFNDNRVAGFELNAGTGANQSNWQYAALPVTSNGGLVALESGVVRFTCGPDGNVTYGESAAVDANNRLKAITDSSNDGNGLFESGLVVNELGGGATIHDFRAESNSDANAIWLDTANDTLHVRAAFVYNENGDNIDARFEGDTDANLLFTDASTDRVGVGTNAPASKLDVVGSFQCDSITSDTGLGHGTYTPTLTNVANVDASTAYPCQWMRVGNTVTVSGKIDIDPTTTVTLTRVGISLPVASNFANDYECAGSGASSTVVREPIAIRADATNNRAETAYLSVSITNHSFFFTFTYQVI